MVRPHVGPEVTCFTQPISEDSADRLRSDTYYIGGDIAR